jgi:hypothetical protein
MPPSRESPIIILSSCYPRHESCPCRTAHAVTALVSSASRMASERASDAAVAPRAVSGLLDDPVGTTRELRGAFAGGNGFLLFSPPTIVTSPPTPPTPRIVLTQPRSPLHHGDGTGTVQILGACRDYAQDNRNMGGVAGARGGCVGALTGLPSAGEQVCPSHQRHTMECQAKTPESEHQEERRVGDALRASLLPWAPLWDAR